MITEGQINKMLKETLEVYEYLKKEGKGEMAKRILRIGSELAQIQLITSGIVQGYVNYTFCPTCGKKHTNSLQREAIHRQGECLSCDHVRAEVDEHFNEAYYE